MKAKWADKLQKKVKHGASKPANSSEKRICRHKPRSLNQWSEFVCAAWAPKKKPFYRIVVADQRSPRDGPFH